MTQGRDSSGSFSGIAGCPSDAAPRPEAPAEPAGPVRVSRRFGAPAETVFDSWLLEGSVGEWLFATPDGESVRAEIERAFAK